MLLEIKEYLRLYDDSDDELLQSLIYSAETYFINAGIKIESFVDDKLYQLALKLLVNHWYSHHEVVGSADKLAFSLEAILNQLKYGDKNAL